MLLLKLMKGVSMQLSDKEKLIITKYAKMIGCDWFELSTDNAGNDCVFDKEEASMLPLCDGISNLNWYMPEVEDVYLNYRSYSIIEENSIIYILDKFGNKKIKSGFVIREFVKRFVNIEDMENQMTCEERDICLDLFHCARLERKQNRKINANE